MSDNDKVILDMAKDVSFIKGVITDYSKMVIKSNENEIRSKENETAISEVRSTQKWLSRLVAIVTITWVLTEVFTMVKG